MAWHQTGDKPLIWPNDGLGCWCIYITAPQCVNSLRSSDTYVSVNLPSLVQIMACHPVGTRPLSAPMLTLRNKLQWNFNWNLNMFIQENVFENVVPKMVAMLSWPQCFNTRRLEHNGQQLTDESFKIIFLNENVYIVAGISLKCFPGDLTDKKSALAQVILYK